MPYGDGTGPTGQGPWEGWRRHGGYGRGFSRGGRGGFRPRGLGRRGFGGGFGRWGNCREDIPQPEAAFVGDRQREVAYLEARAERLQDALQRLNQRLEALKEAGTSTE